MLIISLFCHCLTSINTFSGFWYTFCEFEDQMRSVWFCWIFHWIYQNVWLYFSQAQLSRTMYKMSIHINDNNINTKRQQQQTKNWAKPTRNSYFVFVKFLFFLPVRLFLLSFEFCVGLFVHDCLSYSLKMNQIPFK